MAKRDAPPDLGKKKKKSPRRRQGMMKSSGVRGLAACLPEQKGPFSKTWEIFLNRRPRPSGRIEEDMKVRYSFIDFFPVNHTHKFRGNKQEPNRESEGAETEGGLKKSHPGRGGFSQEMDAETQRKEPWTDRVIQPQREWILAPSLHPSKQDRKRLPIPGIGPWTIMPPAQ